MIAVPPEIPPLPVDPVGRIRVEVATHLPTAHGVFLTYAVTDLVTGDLHLALTSGPPRNGMLVRVHSECLTGEAFDSHKCECGPQLRTALAEVSAHGGAVLYMRGHEGRGIGLLNKLRAYALQEQGLDTVDANLALGLPSDSRRYDAAAAILRAFGVDRVRLLTNNPDKQHSLQALGIGIDELVPLEVGRTAENLGYLRTKASRMGHLLHGLDAGAPAPEDPATGEHPRD